MNMNTRRMSHEIEHGDLTLSLDIRPCDWGPSPIVRELTNGIIVVGYLAHDDSPSNPLKDCDGMGDIVAFNQRDFGFDGTDRPDVQELADELLEEDAVEIAGGEDLDDYEAAEKAVMPAWFDRYNTVDYVALNYNEHDNSEPYSIAAETAEGLLELIQGGYRSHPEYQWEPDKYLLKDYLEPIKDPQKRRAKALEFCQQALESYNKYCTGDVWGVVVVWFDKDGDEIDSDSCWGFLGLDYAEECLEEEMESTIKRLEAEKEEVTA